jgi:putative endonuclease
MTYYVYIIESLSDGTFYKGYSNNYRRRLDEHNAGLTEYTSKKLPWRLVYVEEMESKSAAIKRERQLKRVNKVYLNWLIKQPSNILLEG